MLSAARITPGSHYIQKWLKWTRENVDICFPPPFLPTFLLWRPRLATEPRIPSLEFLGSFWPPPPFPMIYLSSPPSCLPPPFSQPTHRRSCSARGSGTTMARMCCQLLGFFAFSSSFFFSFFFNICFFFFFWILSIKVFIPFLFFYHSY